MDELYHHGILGQRWGVRRYQRIDGTRTNLGKERSRSDYREEKSKTSDAWFKPSIKQGKDRPNISPAEKFFRETQSTADSSKKIVDSYGKMTNMHSQMKNKRALRRAEDMTDAELRAAINRKTMERQYYTLNNADTHRGYEYVSEALAIGGGLASIAVSAATIYSLAKK